MILTLQSLYLHELLTIQKNWHNISTLDGYISMKKNPIWVVLPKKRCENLGRTQPAIFYSPILPVAGTALFWPSQSTKSEKCTLGKITDPKGAQNPLKYHTWKREEKIGIKWEKNSFKMKILIWILLRHYIAIATFLPLLSIWWLAICISWVICDSERYILRNEPASNLLRTTYYHHWNCMFMNIKMALIRPLFGCSIWLRPQISLI